MHRAALEDGIGAESEDEDEENPDLEVDGIDYTGVEYWHGDWTRQFIHDARSGHALAPLEKPVMWDAAHAWGVKVRLQPVRNSVKVDRIMYFDDDDQNPENAAYGGHRKLRLKSYQNRATILEVYVSPTFFEERQEEEIDNSDSEEDERSDVSDEEV